MKSLYTSPVITVEDLTKVDVLCASTEQNYTNSDQGTDNINQLGWTLGDLSNRL